MSKADTRRKPATTPGELPDDVMCAVRAAEDKKAADLVVLDLRDSASFTDFFVICTGQNVRQVKAIAEAVEEALRRSGTRPAHVEGLERGEWVLIDCFDFIVHVFNHEARVFYALDRLWGNATRITFEPPAPQRGDQPTR